MNILGVSVPKGALLLTLLAALVLVVALVYYLKPEELVIESDIILPPEKIMTLPKEVPARSELPVRLKIPSINVDAKIINVGLTADGAMDIPKLPDEVGWFELGPRPGETDSAVMAGHFGWRNNIPAVFDNLHKLRPGDKILVEDNTGKATTFVVRESRSFDPEADASDVFLTNDGKAHLNLITCQGSWSKTDKSYSNRLVVFADIEIRSEQP